MKFSPLLILALALTSPAHADTVQQSFGVAPLSVCNLAGQSECPVCPADHPHRRIMQSRSGTIVLECGTQFVCDNTTCRHVLRYCPVEQKPDYICLTDKELKDATQ